MENIREIDAKQSLSQAFLDYSAYNLQRRAIPDARDGFKWSARQLLHAQYIAKLTYDKPFKKALKSVGQATSFSYCHGDTSAYGTYIRMAKPFAMRVPLQEAHGNFGTQIDPNDHSASRYVELRGSEIASLIFDGIDKNTISEWEDTYDMEGVFPRVLPSKSFYNIVNGCISIGSGMSCSIPPTNLREVNQAMTNLLLNPDCDDEAIVCYPDFPTGGILLNREQVRESMLKGGGSACKIRSLIEYDANERCLIVKELPYSTYTNTICKELAGIMQDDENCGIKEFADYTGINPDLRICLTKNASPNKVLKLLYKNTSLQNYFSVNMVMLENGIVPKVFSWREALQAHIDHEKVVYRRGFEFDLNKINNRLHIIDGLLKAISILDKVIATIKSSSDTKTALANLQNEFEFSEAQAKAILDIKLSRLAHLEVSKLQNEQSELLKEKGKIEEILSDEQLFNQQLINGWKEVADKFGDERRTKILNIENEEDEPIEIRNLMVQLTNQGNLFTSETSSLYTQKRGGVGQKFKLGNGEYVVASAAAKTNTPLFFFSNKGNYYSLSNINGLPLNEKTPIESLLNIKNEKICAMAAFDISASKPYILFVTKKGFVKKSNITEYNTKRSNAVKALELDKDDEIVDVLFISNEKITLLTERGQLLTFATDDIRPIGRAARGVMGVKLNDGDYVVGAQIYVKDHGVLFITKNGVSKRISSNEITYANRYTKGSRICTLRPDDKMVDFQFITANDESLIIASRAQIKLKCADVPETSKGAIGVTTIKLKDNETVIGIAKI